MGIINNLIYGKNKVGEILGLANSDEGDLWMIYDKNVKKDNFYIYFAKRENKKYYSKDIKNFQIINKKEMDGALDYVFGASNIKYIKISLTDGTEKVYEISDSKGGRLRAINFFDKYYKK